jgi:very-short-patch-repair endonuclease
MLKYNPTLHERCRQLRKNMTTSEHHLWYNLRRKQLLNIQFYRQTPIGAYIVDFYAPAAKLVVEVDGGQHFEERQKIYDEKRTKFLESKGLKVLRFDNLEILREMKGVLEIILRVMRERLGVEE